MVDGHSIENENYFFFHSPSIFSFSIVVRSNHARVSRDPNSVSIFSIYDWVGCSLTMLSVMINVVNGQRVFYSTSWKLFKRLFVFCCSDVAMTERTYNCNGNRIGVFHSVEQLC